LQHNRQPNGKKFFVTHVSSQKKGGVDGSASHLSRMAATHSAAKNLVGCMYIYGTERGKCSKTAITNLAETRHKKTQTGMKFRENSRKIHLEIQIMCCSEQLPT
jgi:hypothetical protein